MDAEEDYLDDPAARAMNQDNWLSLARPSEVQSLSAILLTCFCFSHQAPHVFDYSCECATIAEQVASSRLKRFICLRLQENGFAAAEAASAAQAEDGEGAGVGEGLLEGDISVVPREVFVVDTLEKAHQAAARLRALHAANPSMFFACDTEVILTCTTAPSDTRYPDDCMHDVFFFKSE